jgi:hypothetical protein
MSVVAPTPEVAPTPDRPRRHPDLRVWFAKTGGLMLGRGGSSPITTTREVLDVLALCDGRRTLDDVARKLEADRTWPAVSAGAAALVVRATIERARETGLVLAPTPESERQLDVVWARPSIHRRMLNDAPRTEAFRQAIKSVVRPGDTVIDVGAGSGILSAFSARAGAAEVHAVERARIADALREVLRTNGLADVVRVHSGDAASANLPQAQVIVSEWLGVLLFGDLMWPAVAAVRDRCLAPHGAMIPASVDFLLAPLEDPVVRDEGAAWWDAPRYGLDLSAFGRIEAEAPEWRMDLVPADGLLAEPATLLSMDCLKASADAGTFEHEATFEVTRDGTLDGMVAWFVAELAPGVTLDTGPSAPPTHWKQDVLPTRPHPVKKGQRLTVKMALWPVGPDGQTCELEGRLDGAPLFKTRYE